MHEVLNWVWQGCAIALATGATLHVLKRTRARDRYALCWAVLLAVLVLPIVPRLWLSPALHTDVVAPADPLVTMPDAWWTSTQIAIFLWMAWVFVQTVRLVTALITLQRLRRGCTSFPPQVASQLTHWSQVQAQGRHARLVSADGVRSAAVLGCGRPIIAVAPSLVKRLGLEELDRIVIHEWAHVQRRDDLLNVFQLLARTLAGWHPAVWWLNRQLQIEREAACDEIAVAVTGSSKGYASSLATLAGLSPLRSHTIPTLGALSSPMLGKRIVRILSQKNLVSPIWSARAAVAAASSICALSITIAECQIVGTSSVAPLAEERQPVAPQSRVSTSTPTAATAWPDHQQRIGDRTAPAPQSAVDRAVPHPEVPVQSTESRAPGTTTSPETIALEPLRPLDSEFARSNRPPEVRVPARARMITLPTSARPDDAVVSPWGVAADAGATVGRRTQDAAVATAGAFSKLGKKIAASF